MVAVRSQLGWFLGLLTALMLTVGACGDDAGPGTSGTPDTGGDVRPDVSTDPSTDPGEDPVEDQGGDPLTDPTEDPTVDPTVDQSQDLVDSDVVESDVVEPPPCEIDRSNQDWPDTYDLTAGGTRPVKLVILGVDFVNDVVLVRNLLDEAITFDDSWQIWLLGSNARTLNGITMPADSQVRFHLRASGVNSNTDVYLNMSLTSFDIEPCVGEVVILHNLLGLDTTWRNFPDYVEAFILWGGTVLRYTEAQTFADEAVNAGAWTGSHTNSSGYIPACYTTYQWVGCSTGTPGPCTENDRGLLAIGDVTSPSTGWVAITDVDDMGCLR
ncbi:MAG: hypothetical protein JW797_15320 [Bradymonadales bacterium]|nr:hypothetical protein [Bradymonadales bacterium]